MAQTNSDLKQLKRMIGWNIAKNSFITLANLAIIYIEILLIVEGVRLLLK